MKKIIILIFFVLIVVLGIFIAKMVIDNDKAWKVKIITDYINVRSDHATTSAKIDTVHEGRTYKVIEIYLEDKNYVWYKVKLDGGKEGWIASDRDEPYVEEINNPNIDIGEEETIDYKSPVIKFYEEEYKTDSIDTIDLSHLEIEEDSKYELTYEIYREENPEDRPGPQFWIKYIAVDSFDNRTVRVQRIIFEILPSESDDRVLDFEDLNYN